MLLPKRSHLLLQGFDVVLSPAVMLLRAFVFRPSGCWKLSSRTPQVKLPCSTASPRLAVNLSLRGYVIPFLNIRSPSPHNFLVFAFHARPSQAVRALVRDLVRALSEKLAALLGGNHHRIPVF